MIAPIRKNFDAMIGQGKRGRELWWWSDALFMAPPALVRLASATGNGRYLDFMDERWWDTTDFLYDRKERLFYRDEFSKSIRR